MSIVVNGRTVEVPAGCTVAAAAMAAGETEFRRSVTGEPRAPLCGIGVCFECRVPLDGDPHTRTCQLTAGAPHVATAASQSCDVLIAGAGPAGIAAACAAAESGAKVTVIDDNPAAGGQLWRGGARHAGSKQALHWLERFDKCGATLLAGVAAIARPEPGVLVAADRDGRVALRHSKLILATGAHERFLPFPGWTLPNVTGAGGMEALVRGGLPVAGKRVIVAGSGPLLLAVAAELQMHGATVPLIAEQATQSAMASFLLALVAQPVKLAQAARLRWRCRGTRYRTGTWPVAAEGRDKIEAVVLRSGDRTWTEPCDYLACGFGLVPNIELASLAGCEIEEGFVVVSAWQETSVAGVYCAGEPLAIGGVTQALATGSIAGYHAAGNRDAAREWFAARSDAMAFAESMNRAFALRDELREMTADDTLVCRCEDVPLSRIKELDGWRDAKLHTRCGMGPCQGRICGPAVRFLMRWRGEAARPPVFPARVRDLIAGE